jgi:hypothetical protein
MPPDLQSNRLIAPATAITNQAHGIADAALGPFEIGEKRFHLFCIW